MANTLYCCSCLLFLCALYHHHPFAFLPPSSFVDIPVRSLVGQHTLKYLSTQLLLTSHFCVGVKHRLIVIWTVVHIMWCRSRSPSFFRPIKCCWGTSEISINAQFCIFKSAITKLVPISENSFKMNFMLSINDVTYPTILLQIRHLWFLFRTEEMLDLVVVREWST